MALKGLNLNNFENYEKKVDEAGKSKRVLDPRMFNFSKQKEGTYNIVLFPDKSPENEGFINMKFHRFSYNDENGNQGIWNHICHQERGQKCDICKRASELWNSGVEDLKEEAKKMFAKKVFFSNVLVVLDNVTPDQVGQMKIYEYTEKLFKDKIACRIQPSDANKNNPSFKKFNPFYPLKTAPFVLSVIINDSNYPDYSSSDFDVTELGKARKIVKGEYVELSDEEIESYLNQTTILAEFANSHELPTEEELSKLNVKLGKAALNTETVSAEELFSKDKTTTDKTAAKDKVVEEKVVEEKVEQKKEVKSKKTAVDVVNSAKEDDTSVDGDFDISDLDDL